MTDEIVVSSLAELRGAMRAARSARGLRQEDLAEATGLERKTIIGIERDSEPRLDNLIKVAHQLGYDLVLRPRESPDLTLEPDDVEDAYGFDDEAPGMR